MNYKDLRIIISQIKKNIQCPKCKSSYTDKDIEIIGSMSNDQTFFHADCAKCHAEAVINVAIQLDNSDIITPELKRLPNGLKDKFSINEVLDIHNFLSDFDGNFQELFEVQK